MRSQPRLGARDAVVALCGLALVLFLTAGCGGRNAEPGAANPEIPAPDTGPMQPRVAESVREARDAVVREPGSGEAWGTFAAVCDAHDLLECAATGYERALELAAADFRWPYLLAFVRERLGADIAVIAELYERSARLSPRFPTVQFRLGEALLRQGRLDPAGRAYARAAELDPRLALAHLGLGQVLLARGKPADALAELGRALELGGEDARVLSALAQARHLTGDADGAAEAARRSRDTRREIGLPDPVRTYVQQLGVSSSHLYARANRLLAAGRFAEAIPLLLAVEEFRPSAGVYHRLGVAHERSGKPDLALEYFARALAEDPDHQGTHKSMGLILEQRGEHERAAEHLRRASEPEPSGSSGGED